jgi:predicted dehydrogenase
MSRLKVGIIGVGGIAEVAHMPGYAAAGAEIRGLATSRPDAVRALADRFGVRHVDTDHRTLLQRDDIEAVSVCVPTALHEDVVVAALEAGKHVLCEKPPGIAAAQAERMHAAAIRADRLLCYALSARFGPAAKKARTLAEAGRLGDVYAARAGWMRRRGNPAGWFTQRDLAGGGALIDMGVHGLDLAWWLMGNPTPVAASGATYRAFGNYASDDAATPDLVMQRHLTRQPKQAFDVEDAGFAFVRFEGGAHLMLEAAWALNARGESRYVTLYGTAGGMHLTPATAEFFGEMEGTLLDGRLHVPEASGYLEQMRHFVRAVRGEEPPVAPSQHGVTLMKMLDAIYASASSGREASIA